MADDARQSVTCATCVHVRYVEDIGVHIECGLADLPIASEAIAAGCDVYEQAS